MPAYKVLKSDSINGREPQPSGTVMILSESEAAPFLASNAIEVTAAGGSQPPLEPVVSSPAIATVETIPNEVHP